MRILVAAVGRAKRGPAQELYRIYAGRLAWKIELKEVEERRRLPAAEMKVREGRLLLDAIPGDAAVVALDESGRSLDSEGFAGKLADWRDQGRRTVAFVIGGPDGLDGRVLFRADLVLSLGPMTWPHMLVRGMLAEQLYRAQTILSGHPYHRP